MNDYQELSKTLLIIGAGTEQVPAYQRAKARGLKVVGTDLNPSAPAFQYADESLIASTRDAEETLRVVTEFNSKYPVNGVMTIANDVPYTVARVANALNLPAITIEAAICASNKLIMKERFVEHGVSCPWFQEIKSSEELSTIRARRSGKLLVLKPIDGRGARGVLLINEDSDLTWSFSESTRWGDSGRVMIEEFIPGMQLSTESFILNGVCYTPAISERNYSNLKKFYPYIIEDGGTIPAPLTGTQKEMIDDLILRGALAMGIDKGIVKGDIVINPDGKPFIIELAARLSGGWFATHQIPEATGVDLVNAVISYALGEDINPEIFKPTCNRATAIRYWFPKEGIIKSIQGEDKLKSMDRLISYGFFRNVGEYQPVVRTHPDRFGYVIVSGNNRDDVISRISEALDSINVETQTASQTERTFALADKLTGGRGM